MDKKTLEQYGHLKREILMWEAKLKKLEEASKAKAQPTYMLGGRSGLISDPTGNAGMKNAEIEEIIAGLKAEAEITRKNIIIYIATLEDSCTRQLINYRCLELLSWPEIAKRIGGNNTADSLRMQFNRMFEKNKKKR